MEDDRREGMECASNAARWSCETGKRLALQTVLERDGRNLRRLAERLATNPVDAEDLLQDTLERAIRQAPRHLQADELRAWLLRVLRNLFIDHCRAQRARLHALERLHEEQQTFVVAAEQTSRAWTDIDEVDLRLAIEQLDRSFRDVLRLSLCLRSQAQIASALGVEKTTVRTRLFRAKRKVHSLLIHRHSIDVETAPSRSSPRGVSDQQD